jgi:TolB-like protein
MKRCVLFLCVLSIVFSGSVWAAEAEKETKRVAVLPFSVHSSEDITYVRDGIWDMLISRLSVTEGVSVTPKQEVREALKTLGGKEPAVADVYGLGKRLNLDYAVWGSITKIGNSVSLDAKLLDVSTYKTPVGVFEQCQGMDDVIPRISDFAKKIHYHILGITPPAAEATSLPPAGKQRPAASPLTVPEGKVIQTREGTFTSVINPAFITSANPLAQKGFWMSQRYKKTFKGMDIGDVDGDGKNEVIAIDDRTIEIYQREGMALALRTKISGESYDQFLAVDVADINGNGIAEIIVTNLAENKPKSFVMEFRDGKFEKIASGLEWFMRITDTEGGPVLMGQGIMLGDPLSGPIHEIVWRNGAYREGRRMLIPEGLSVFGVLLAKIDGGTERVVALDEYDHINILEKTKKPLSKIHIVGGSDNLLWISYDVYGGSNNKIYLERRSSGIDTNEDAGGSVYVKERLLSYDTNGDGKKELVVVKNLSPSGRIMKNVRVFTRSEIYNLEWDGLGLAENWRTKRIQGYVADYQIKDIDNDGKDEVVLLVGLGTTLTRSAIVAYDLDVPDAS